MRNKFRYILAISALTVNLLPTKASVRHTMLPPDTVIDRYDYDEVEMQADSLAKSRRNLTKGRDISKYILEGRYHKYGDLFSNKWYNHLFIQAGAGMERIVPPTSSYKYDALSAFQLGLGKQVSSLSTVRLLFHGEYGYQRHYDYSFYKLGVRADYIFSLSDYFNGYNPSRPFNISSILGFGYQYANATQHNTYSFKPEAHVGAQFKFYTGPQGYFTIEPFAGIGSDQMDASEKRNWRNYDVFYGVNLNYICYLQNNLSREAKMRLLDSRSRGNYLTRDSLLHSWRMPWFVEATNGLNLSPTSNNGMSPGSSLGSSATFGVGKWFSPVIGLKLSAFSQSMVWMKNSIAATTSQPSYTLHYNSILFGGRLEAMFNPLGFNRNYDWDAPFGCYLVFGINYGHLKKYPNSSNDELSCSIHGYTAGLRLWGRLSRDLQIFMEPRYSYDVYRVPYNNVDWYQRSSERSLGVNFGLTMLMRTMKYRRIGDSDLFLRHVKHAAFGVTGGFNTMQNKGPVYEADRNYSWNAGLYGEFHFDYVNAVRLSAEVVTRHVASPSQYYDIHFEENTQQNERFVKTGLWNHLYRLGFASLDYNINLTSLLSGHQQGRLFELEFFLGPTFVHIFQEGGRIDSSVQQGNHQTILSEFIDKGNKWGANGGFKLMGNINKYVSITFTPTLYIINNLNFPGLNTMNLFSRFSVMETMNLGIQYRFQVFK